MLLWNEERAFRLICSLHSQNPKGFLRLFATMFTPSTVRMWEREKWKTQILFRKIISEIRLEFSSTESFSEIKMVENYVFTVKAKRRSRPKRESLHKYPWNWCLFISLSLMEEKNCKRFFTSIQADAFAVVNRYQRACLWVNEWMLCNASKNTQASNEGGWEKIAVVGKSLSNRTQTNHNLSGAIHRWMFSQSVRQL